MLACLLPQIGNENIYMPDETPFRLNHLCKKIMAVLK